MEPARIFICDENSESQQHLRGILEGRGHAVEPFDNGTALLRRLEENREDHPHLVLLDAQLPGTAGLEILRRLRTLRSETPVIVMSAFATVRGAVESLKQGAEDYLIKPIFSEELLALVDKMVDRNRLMAENRSLKAQIRQRFDPDQVVFKSPAFRRVFELARKVAPSEANVLILGESGTGKELIASTVHYASHRREERFLTINCAALTDTLLESQLFGHVKGAFTGAVTSQRGLVEEAHKGTLFLDEIGDISPGLQAKLLRVVQEREYLPVGSTRVRQCDVRFIAATNRDLEQEVARGAFRADLFYRLNVVRLQIPPLRERREDVEILARHFLLRHGGNRKQTILPDTLKRLCAYAWPGNVRELENVLEMAVILAGGEDLAPEHLPARIAEARKEGGFSLPEESCTLEALERLYIDKIYRKNNGHKMRTSEILGISRKTLNRKLRQYEISLT